MRRRSFDFTRNETITKNMKRFGILLIVLAGALLLPAVEPSVYIDCRFPEWREQAREELRKKPQSRSLDIRLPGEGEMELPEHDFSNVNIYGWAVHHQLPLTILAKYKLTSLTLNGGNFTHWHTLKQPELKVLKADSVDVDAAELAQAELPKLQELVIYCIKGRVLDLRRMPDLERLTFHNCDPGLQILLDKKCKLKYLTLPKGTSHIPAQLDLSQLEFLCTREPWDVRSVRMPKLKKFILTSFEDNVVELPPLPELHELCVLYGGKISLAMVKKQCPKLRSLGVQNVRGVGDWEALPQIALERLWVCDVPGVKYQLPVAAPEGCRVEGLPSFIENPYKMWCAWGLVTAAFAAWTWWRQRKNAKGER